VRADLVGEVDDMVLAVDDDFAADHTRVGVGEVEVDRIVADRRAVRTGQVVDHRKHIGTLPPRPVHPAGVVPPSFAVALASAELGNVSKPGGHLVRGRPTAGRQFGVAVELHLKVRTLPPPH
jgi:hypothetical protein